WFLHGLRAEEDCVVGVFVMAERQEAEIRQFEFAAVGDADFGRAFAVHVAIVGLEEMGWQVVHLAAALGAANGDAETGFGEAAGHPHAHGIGGIHPAIFFMI